MHITLCGSGDPLGRRRLAGRHRTLPLFLTLFVMLTAGDAVLVAQQVWEARYNGPGNSDDGATAIAADDSGNVYVTGYSTTSDSSSAFATIKYDTAGNQLWARQHSASPTRDNGATALAVDRSGNVVVTGYSATSDTSSAYVTVKYDTAGTELWVRLYSDVQSGENGPVALAVDTSGNIYVTGYSTGSGTGIDYTTIKYGASGDTMWVRQFTSPGDREDSPSAIAVDRAGNCYVTGYSFDSDTSSSYATVKYDPSGTEQWARRYGAPTTIHGATAIVVDDSGNAYVTGYSFDSDASSSYATVKYDGAGQQQWVARYNGPGRREDGATGLVVSASGDLYVTGYSYDSDTSSAYATIKYDFSGVEQWALRFNRTGSADDGATAIAVDDSGNVYVTGYSVDTGAGSDYATIKYAASGDSVWVVRYDGPGNSEDGAAAIVHATAGKGSTLYVTGYSTGSGTGSDFATIRYNTSGPAVGRMPPHAGR